MFFFCCCCCCAFVVDVKHGPEPGATLIDPLSAPIMERLCPDYRTDNGRLDAGGPIVAGRIPAAHLSVAEARQQQQQQQQQQPQQHQQQQQQRRRKRALIFFFLKKKQKRPLNTTLIRRRWNRVRSKETSSFAYKGCTSREPFFKKQQDRYVQYVMSVAMKWN